LLAARLLKDKPVELPTNAWPAVLAVATELTVFLTLKGIGQEALNLEAQQHCCDHWTKEVMKNADAGHTHIQPNTDSLLCIYSTYPLPTLTHDCSLLREKEIHR
jgi:hypothetical protein